MVEVLRRFNLFDSVILLQRKQRCNGLLEPVSKETIIDQLLPKVQQLVNEFDHCIQCNMQCDQIYWKGLHYEQMKKKFRLCLALNSIPSLKYHYRGQKQQFFSEDAS